MLRWYFLYLGSRDYYSIEVPRGMTSLPRTSRILHILVYPHILIYLIPPHPHALYSIPMEGIGSGYHHYQDMMTIRVS